MLPVPEASVRAPGPSNVLKKVCDWLAAEVSIEAVPTTVTPLAKETAPPIVFALESCVVPPPPCVKVPAMDVVAAELNVAVLVFVKENGPAAVV